MAATPVYVSTPVLLVASNVATSTDKTGAGAYTDLVARGSASPSTTAPAAGRKIERIIVKADGDPADGIVLIFVHDGAGTPFIFLLDEFDIGNPAAGSTTISAYREERPYSDLVLPQGCKLQAAVTVAPTAGNIDVIAFGGELT